MGVVFVEEVLKTFNQSLKRKDHILLMIKEPIRMLVELEQEHFYLTLDRKRLLIKHVRPLNSYHIKIETTTDDFYSLINGRTSLKQEVDEKRIALTATFRQLLKLDAIFLLNRELD